MNEFFDLVWSVFGSPDVGQLIGLGFAVFALGFYVVVNSSTGAQR